MCCGKQNSLKGQPKAQTSAPQSEGTAGVILIVGGRAVALLIQAGMPMQQPRERRAAGGCLPPQACCIIKREQRASHGTRTIPCSARGEGGAPLLRERQAAAVPRPCSAAGRNAHVKAGGTEYKWQLPQRHTALHGQGTPRAGEPGHPHTTPNLLRLIQGASTCPFFLPALSQQPLDVQNLPVLFRSVCKSRIPPSFCSAALVRCPFKNQTYSIPLFSYFSVYQTVSQVG